MADNQESDLHHLKAENERLNEQLNLYETRNAKLKVALQPFADLYRERMLEDTQVRATNGMCRRAKDVLEGREAP